MIPKLKRNNSKTASKWETNIKQETIKLSKMKTET
jgi:hypothetical protein